MIKLSKKTGVKFSRWSLFALAMIVILASCSDSDDSSVGTGGADSAGGDEGVGGADSTGGDNGDGSGDDSSDGDVIVDGPAPITPLINSSTSRTIAIESLELVGSLVYFFSDATADLLSFDSEPVACDGTGSVSKSSTTTTQDFSFVECTVASDVRFNGEVGFDGAFESGFTGTQSFTNFQMTNDNRTVSINGTATVIFDSGSVDVSAAELVINDSQSDTTLKQSAFSLTDASTENQRLMMTVIADAPRFGLEDVQVGSSGLVGGQVSCPQSGAMTINASSNGSLRIDGNTGRNVLYALGDLSDTLACTEIAHAPGYSQFTPPPSPGN